ncbi:hypothetical protein EAI_02218 [Harpegnathos saltator]|uniref:Uncharacterized protein n=1 Tax=Harpegnathos saltator TaxID=610380 RepID=E2BLR7_HARSA|nr:hypothetical protein EAI_02218 [Harpegnathos saltator]
MQRKRRGVSQQTAEGQRGRAKQEQKIRSRIEQSRMEQGANKAWKRGERQIGHMRDRGSMTWKIEKIKRISKGDAADRGNEKHRGSSGSRGVPEILEDARKFHFGKLTNLKSSWKARKLENFREKDDAEIKHFRDTHTREK